jgi:hypothetical protein
MSVMDRFSEVSFVEIASVASVLSDPTPRTLRAGSDGAVAECRRSSMKPDSS